MANLPITRLLLRSLKPLTQEDARDIKANLANSPGIGTVEVDVAAGVIAAMTAAQDGGAQLIRHLHDAGFPVEVAVGDRISTERNTDPLPGDGANLGPDQGPARGIPAIPAADPPGKID